MYACRMKQENRPRVHFLSWGEGAFYTTAE